MLNIILEHLANIIAIIIFGGGFLVVMGTISWIITTWMERTATEEIHRSLHPEEYE